MGFSLLRQQHHHPHHHHHQYPLPPCRPGFIPSSPMPLCLCGRSHMTDCLQMMPLCSPVRGGPWWPAVASRRNEAARGARTARGGGAMESRRPAVPLSLTECFVFLSSVSRIKRRKERKKGYLERANACLAEAEAIPIISVKHNSPGIMQQ